jgi:hypothetical protein
MHVKTERRRSERRPIVRPAKLYDPRGRRYLSGLTLNVSSHGLLMTVRGGEYLPAGAELRVAVAARESSVLRRDRMARVKVVRNEGRYAGSAVMAVQFAHPLPLRVAA